MNNALIIDGALLVLLLIGYLIGAHRGLFKSLMGFAEVIVALVGATLVADAATPPVTDFLVPKVEQRVTEWLGTPEEMTMGQFFSGTASSSATTNPTFSEWFQKLGKWGAQDRFFAHFKEETANAAQTAARSLVENIVHTVLFLLSLIVFLILLKLLTNALDHIFALPVLRTLNTFGGGLLGLLETALFIYLALWLAPRFGIIFLRDNAEHTYLLNFFSTYTPLAIIASLNGGK